MAPNSELYDTLENMYLRQKKAVMEDLRNKKTKVGNK
jgi:hypothetical protein